MKILGILLLLLVAYLIWQRQELKKFAVTHYTVDTDKLAVKKRLVIVADLHSHVYGQQNEPLIQAVRAQKPDLILIPGDMIVSAETDRYETALHVIEALVQIAPVYYSNGNHESRVRLEESPYYAQYHAYEEKVCALGVHMLNNASEQVTIGNDTLLLHGIEIPLDCYHKGKTVSLPEHYLCDKLGEGDPDQFQILLAHYPSYAPQYAQWGADLTVSGHTHGGLIRIPGVGSVFSPQFQFFPKYDAGEWSIGARRIIVSRGLGTHTFNIRIFNRAELAVVDLSPKVMHE